MPVDPPRRRHKTGNRREELSDSKDGETVKNFLKTHLDTDKLIFVVTDLYRGYKGILEEVFGDKATRQLCLLHLNRLIVNDFSRNKTIKQELIKYELLNIFYNRELEIEFLRSMADEEQIMKIGDERDYKRWLWEARCKFRDFVHALELKRRRKNQNLEQRPYDDALNNFYNMMDRVDSFKMTVKKRLRKIEELWPNLTALYVVDGAPATNNAIENY